MKQRLKVSTSCLFMTCEITQNLNMALKLVMEAAEPGQPSQTWAKSYEVVFHVCPYRDISQKYHRRRGVRGHVTSSLTGQKMETGS